MFASIILKYCMLYWTEKYKLRLNCSEQSSFPSITNVTYKHIVRSLLVGVWVPRSQRRHQQALLHKPCVTENAQFHIYCMFLYRFLRDLMCHSTSCRNANGWISVPLGTKPGEQSTPPPPPPASRRFVNIQMLR